jgi:hypothetical protein
VVDVVCRREPGGSVIWLKISAVFSITPDSFILSYRSGLHPVSEAMDNPLIENFAVAFGHLNT